jgi:hypothetical protein
MHIVNTYIHIFVLFRYVGKAMSRCKKTIDLYLVKSESRDARVTAT